jgi:DNA polymerase-1
VFGVPPEQVDKEMRRRAKIINFGILYGMGVNALRQNLNTDRAEAQRFYNEYFKNFSGLARYLDRVKAKARRLGYTETYFGRRRYFEGIHSSIPYIQAAAERMAVNAPIQGTQADIIKIAMVRIHKYITQERLDKGIFLLLQVHDELVYEVRQDFVEASVSKIQEIMESVLAPKDTGGIPLVTTVSLGHNWGEMETV